MNPAMSSVMSFVTEPSSLTEANNQVNTVMSRDRDD